ncbi:hypothetical protein PSPO01_00860 [Paraphaeosphaeria sporulosa]
MQQLRRLLSDEPVALVMVCREFTPDRSTSPRRNFIVARSNTLPPTGFSICTLYALRTAHMASRALIPFQRSEQGFMFRLGCASGHSATCIPPRVIHGRLRVRATTHKCRNSSLAWAAGREVEAGARMEDTVNYGFVLGRGPVPV